MNDVNADENIWFGVKRDAASVRLGLCSRHHPLHDPPLPPLLDC
jgi:hypothetical protein